METWESVPSNSRLSLMLLSSWPFRAGPSKRTDCEGREERKENDRQGLIMAFCRATSLPSRTAPTSSDQALARYIF